MPQRPRGNRPTAEQLLWTAIRDRQLKDYKFRQQHGVGQYVVDFYCPLLKLAIDIEGYTHDSPDTRAYEKARKVYLDSLGIKTVRVANQGIYKTLDRVIAQILSAINIQERLLPQDSSTVEKPEINTTETQVEVED